MGILYPGGNRCGMNPQGEKQQSSLNQVGNSVESEVDRQGKDTMANESEPQSGPNTKRRIQAR